MAEAIGSNVGQQCWLGRFQDKKEYPVVLNYNSQRNDL